MKSLNFTLPRIKNEKWSLVEERGGVDKVSGMKLIHNFSKENLKSILQSESSDGRLTPTRYHH